jgi:hypothetical protein
VAHLLFDAGSVQHDGRSRCGATQLAGSLLGEDDRTLGHGAPLDAVRGMISPPDIIAGSTGALKSAPPNNIDLTGTEVPSSSAPLPSVIRPHPTVRCLRWRALLARECSNSCGAGAGGSGGMGGGGKGVAGGGRRRQGVIDRRMRQQRHERVGRSGGDRRLRAIRTEPRTGQQGERPPMGTSLSSGSPCPDPCPLGPRAPAETFRA